MEHESDLIILKRVYSRSYLQAVNVSDYLPLISNRLLLTVTGTHLYQVKWEVSYRDRLLPDVANHPQGNCLVMAVNHSDPDTPHALSWLPHVCTVK